MPLRLDVVHVVESSGGGVGRHVVDLAGGLVGLGLRVGIVYSPIREDARFAAALTRLASAGVRVHALPISPRLAPGADLIAAARLWALVRRWGARILHLHSSKAGGVGRLAGLGVPGTAVVYTPHGVSSHIAAGYRMLERVLGTLRTDALVAVSATEHDGLAAERLVTRAKLRQVDNGIDLGDLDRLAAAVPTVPDPGGPVVCSLGRLSRQKNPLLLVEASALILANAPATRFLWIGDGELRAPVERRIAELGAGDRWRISGWLENPYPALRAASVFVLPSVYEAMPYATLEAMALGVPAVGTRVAGNLDLISHGETGLLTEPGSVSDLAGAILGLLGDAHRRRAMGDAARTRAARFSLARMVDEIARLYGSLVPEVSARVGFVPNAANVL